MQVSDEFPSRPPGKPGFRAAYSRRKSGRLGRTQSRATMVSLKVGGEQSGDGNLLSPGSKRRQGRGRASNPTQKYRPLGSIDYSLQISEKKFLKKLLVSINIERGKNSALSLGLGRLGKSGENWPTARSEETAAAKKRPTRPSSEGSDDTDTPEVLSNEDPLAIWKQMQQHHKTFRSGYAGMRKEIFKAAQRVRDVKTGRYFLDLFKEGEGRVSMPERPDGFLRKGNDVSRSVSIYERKIRKAALAKQGVSVSSNRSGAVPEWKSSRAEDGAVDGMEGGGGDAHGHDPNLELGAMNFLDVSRQYLDLGTLKRAPMPLRLPTYTDVTSSMYSFLDNPGSPRSPGSGGASPRRGTLLHSPRGFGESPRRGTLLDSPRRGTLMGNKSPKGGPQSPKSARERLDSRLSDASNAMPLRQETDEQPGPPRRRGIHAGVPDKGGGGKENRLAPATRLQHTCVRFVASQVKKKMALSSRLRRLDEDRIETYTAKFTGFKQKSRGQFGGMERDLASMRTHAEQSRVAKKRSMAHQITWYRAMLESVVAHGRHISPAEHHILQTVKHYLEMGYEFTKDIFYRLVPSLTADEMKRSDVAKMLMTLAKNIGIEPEELHNFLIKKSLHIPQDLLDVLAERITQRTGQRRRSSKFMVPFAAARWKRKSMKGRASVLATSRSPSTTIIRTAEDVSVPMLQSPPAKTRSRRATSLHRSDTQDNAGSKVLTFSVRRTASDDMAAAGSRRVTFLG